MNADRSPIETGSEPLEQRVGEYDGHQGQDARFYYINGIYFNTDVSVMKQAGQALGIEVVTLTLAGGITADSVPVKENETQVEVRARSAEECDLFSRKVEEIKAKAS